MTPCGAAGERAGQPEAPVPSGTIHNNQPLKTMPGRIITRPTDPELSPIKATIYRTRDKNGFRELVVYIDGSGKLALEGYEIGPITLSVWGDSDYEYWIAVLPENKPRVLAALREEDPEPPDGIEDRPAAERTDDWELVLRIKNRFSDRVALRDWLTDHGIKHDFISWA